MERHDERVSVIAKRVREFYDRSERFRIYHGHTNSTRRVQRSRDNTVDTSGLNNVISVDPSLKTALVEPNVCMEDFVEATLKCGLIAPVVPELRGITLGGAFAGTAGESSSFKYGLFDSTVNRIEVVLADGTIVQASTSEHADLLYGSAGACGTLGVVTLLEVQLIKAEPYVQLSYHLVDSATHAIESTKETCSEAKQGSVDFVDGILFSSTSGVVLSGKFVSTVPTGTKLQRFTRARDQHFYRHVEKTLLRLRREKSREKVYSDTIPIRDYLFRYDRGSFWGAKIAFNYFKVPFNRITRWALDPFMASKVMFHAMHESGLADWAIIQDVAFPIDDTAKFIKFSDETLHYYPLWLCPLRPTSESQVGVREKGFGVGKQASIDSMFCNVGVWMMAPSHNHEDFVKLNRDIESKVRELDGLKTLYAHVYYTEEEFWSIYDREKYEVLRAKYNASTLPSIYDKVAVKRLDPPNGSERGLKGRLRKVLRDVWPFRGVYGVWKVVTSKEYLIKKS